MSKVYICSTSRRDRSTRVLEVPTTTEAKEVFKRIKRRMPGVSIGVYGAKDFATFQRTQRNLKVVKLAETIPAFIRMLADEEQPKRRIRGGVAARRNTDPRTSERLLQKAGRH